MHIYSTERIMYLRCRKKFDYVIHGIVPKYDTKNTWLGKGIHTALANYYKSGIDLVRSWESYAQKNRYRLRVEDAETYDDLYQLGKGMLENYSKHSINDNWKIVEVEKTLTVTIDGLEISFTPDLIIIEDGLMYVVDHKTCQYFKSEVDIDNDDQLCFYVWALKKLDYPIYGAYYNMIRKKLPTVPQMLKNGGLSKNISIDTDYDTYYNTIIKYGLNVQDYEDILEVLKGKRFIHRLPIYYSNDRLERFEYDLKAFSKEIQSEHRGIFPTINGTCPYSCEYYGLCIAELNKIHVDLVLEEYYQIVEPENRRNSIGGDEDV